MDLDVIPPNFDMHFFEGSIPEEWRLLLERSVEEVSVPAQIPYFNYNNYLVKLEKGYWPDEYIVDVPSLRYTLMKMNPNEPIQNVISLVEGEVDKIWKALRRGTDPIIFREEETVESFAPLEELDENQWMAILVDLDNDRLAGYYFGEYEPDFSSAHRDNFLVIHPDYRGRNLCVPFVAFTYANVLQRVKEMHVRNSSKPGIVGCRCYSKAAQRIGAELLVGNTAIDAKDCNSDRVGDDMLIKYHT